MACVFATASAATISRTRAPASKPIMMNLEPKHSVILIQYQLHSLHRDCFQERPAEDGAMVQLTLDPPESLSVSRQ